MKVIATIEELQAQSRRWKRDGHVVALVPTMGALHSGHLSLVRAARRKEGDRQRRPRVVVSIFVNPLQFGPNEDYGRYPRTLGTDLMLLERAGVDAVFHPSVDEMYPAGFDTQVKAGAVAGPLEGRARPGHFDGVATVVARLLGAAIADRAYFGQKDAQQLAVIRRMVRDLAIPVEIIGCPTVRESDGLAMSSRNRYLQGPDREHALALVTALAEAQGLYREGIHKTAQLEAAMRQVLASVPGVVVEYARIVDPATFEPPAAGGEGLALIAARIGPARLIDNASLASGDVLAHRRARPVGRHRAQPRKETHAWNA
ncbi:MAG: pantoate--beta-alanine ligase [Chloroflexota bacterium]|jgi:pantoate--beta-alanine ligase|nr:pantoate--beta-alanine ligase [Chloroflexota bacterium]